MQYSFQMQEWILLGHITNMLKKGQRIFTGLGASPMGYALPASIGAYYATKSDQTIVCRWWISNEYSGATSHCIS